MPRMARSEASGGLYVRFESYCGSTSKMVSVMADKSWVSSHKRVRVKSRYNVMKMGWICKND